MHMDIFLQELVVNHMLPLSKNSPPVPAQMVLHSIVVYEPEKNKESALRNALVFFPHDTRRRLTSEQLNALAKAQCALVVYESDTLLSGGNGMLPLPVFAIPDTCSISKVIEECYQYVFSDIQKLAALSLDTMETLSNELLAHKNEEANLIRVSEDLLKCPVAFTTSDFHLHSEKKVPQNHIVTPLYVEDVFDWNLALKGFRVRPENYCSELAAGLNHSKIGGYLYDNDYCRQQNCRIFIFPIPHKNGYYGYMFIAPDCSFEVLPREMGMKVQQILATLKFEIIKSDAIAQTVNRYYDFIFDELIESDQTDFRKLMQKYGLLNKPIADAYCVLIVAHSPQNFQDNLYELMVSQQFNNLYDQVLAALGTVSFFMFERKNQFILFLPQQIVNTKRNIFSVLEMMFRNFFKEQYQGIGVSDIMTTEQVRHGYFDAAKALKVSQLSVDRKSTFFSELGILRFFFDRSNELDMTPLCQVYSDNIVPILRYDELHGGNLFPTLTAYLKSNSSPSATCAALYIHKNTLYSRLNKISQVLGKDILDSEAGFTLMLGIKIHMLVETGVLPPDFGR